ncbi:hypothetical protein J6590_069884 [Homalodisca vitripennis]|nr:hypothetical protein J6590_069884 [Homalodisca vitripennis]
MTNHQLPPPPGAAGKGCSGFWYSLVPVTSFEYLHQCFAQLSSALRYSQSFLRFTVHTTSSFYNVKLSSKGQFIESGHGANTPSAPDWPTPGSESTGVLTTHTE